MQLGEFNTEDYIKTFYTELLKGKLKMKTLDDIMSYLEAIFAKIFLQAGVLKFIGATLVTIYAFFIPITGFLQLTAVLVTADFVTGIVASRNPKNKEDIIEIQSRRMQRSIYKIIVYSIALIVAHYIQVILIPNIEAPYFATFYIASTELKSLDENMNRIFGVSILGFLSEKIDKMKNQK